MKNKNKNTTEQIENRYKCPNAIWKKLTEKQRVIYNNMRTLKIEFMAHPKMVVSVEQWETLSHNFAYMAAIEHE